MNDALYIAATGMHTQQSNVDTIANNLANINTPGFKKGRMNFQDLVYRGLGAPRIAEDGIGVDARGSGVAGAISKLFMPGEVKRTENPLDVAIQGDGFIEVLLPDGTPAYSRGGALQVNRDGFLATAGGHVIKPNIYIGADVKEFTIGSDGRVTVRGRGQSGETEVGRLELVRFTDASGLTALGDNLYRPTHQSGDAVYGRAGEDGLGTVMQGAMEASNVKLVDEMVNLMVAQRAYEMNVKVIQATDEMLGMSNNLRR